MKKMIRRFLLKAAERILGIVWINRLLGCCVLCCIRIMTPFLCYLRPEKAEEPFDREYIESYLKYCEKKIIPGSSLLEFAGQVTYAERLKVENLNISLGAYIGEKLEKKGCDFYFDLRDEQSLPTKKFNCIICTQVLGYFIEPVIILQNLKKMLEENGVLILTVSGPAHMDRGEKYLSFYSVQGIRELCKKVFGEENISDLFGYGNLESAIGGLTGMRRLNKYRVAKANSTSHTGISVIVGVCCYNR